MSQDDAEMNDVSNTTGQKPVTVTEANGSLPPNPGPSQPNVNPPPVTNKRVFVEADSLDTELPDKKRGKMELNKVQRDNVLRFFIAAHIRITAKLVTVEDNEKWFSDVLTDLHMSQQVTSIFCTVHHCLRQESLNSGELKTTMDAKSYSVSTAGKKDKEMSHKDMKAMIKELATSFSLPYSRPPPDDNNHWYGTISPLICFTNMFKVRMGELRIGHSAMVAKKTDGKTHYVAVSQYGFYPPHHINLEGISLPPEKKSGMAQSLGPLTCLISLAKSDPTHKYSQRWKSAVQKTMSFLPEIDSIVQVCAGKKASEVKRVFNIIADILLMTTSRESKRMSMPGFMLIQLLNKAETQHYLANNSICTTVTDISYFNFSGNGAFFHYNQQNEKVFKYPIKESKKDLLPQIIFHAIWGTFAEDFGILAFMTGLKTWKRRNEMDDAFEKIGTQKLQEFKIIPFQKYSKLTSANQTGLLSVTSSQVTSRSPFSGKTKHSFGEEFFQYMEATHSNIGASKKDLETLANILQATKVSLLEGLKANPIQDRGTTDWFDAASMTATAYGTQLKDRPSTTKEFFLQSGNK